MIEEWKYKWFWTDKLYKWIPDYTYQNTAYSPFKICIREKEGIIILKMWHNMFEHKQNYQIPFRVGEYLLRIDKGEFIH